MNVYMILSKLILILYAYAFFIRWHWEIARRALEADMFCGSCLLRVLDFVF